MKAQLKFEKASLKDIKQIHNLIERYARKGLMLYRTREKIAQNIRESFVSKHKNKIIGCVGLKIWDEKSAEIYGLAVDSEHMNKGIGTKLITNAVKEAKKLGIKFIFALTFRKNLFISQGFKKISLNSLPRIVFTEKTINEEKAYGMRLK